MDKLKVETDIRSEILWWGNWSISDEQAKKYFSEI